MATKIRLDSQVQGTLPEANAPLSLTKTPSVSTTEVASQGGLLINIDNAVGGIARTTAGWIEDAKYGMYLLQNAAAISAVFDTAVLRTGTKTLKLSTTNATGTGNVSMIPEDLFSSTSIETLRKHAIPMKASTKYKLTCWAKTTNAATSSVCLTIRGWDNTTGNATGAIVSSNTLTGTNDWTLLSINFTTTANASQSLAVTFQNSVSGNVSDAWFDVNSMTLEEITEPVTNSLTSKSTSIVGFTAVGSTDNVDQSQTSKNTGKGFGGGDATISNSIAQQFLPSKSSITGVVLQRIAGVGSFAGTVTVSITNDNSGEPGTTTYASYTYDNASWLGLAADTDFTVPLPCRIVADGVTKYWIKLSASTSDVLNYTVVRADTTQPYSNGIYKGTISGLWTAQGVDLYFKTLYYKPSTNFTARQNNDVVSISADSDGFLEGAKIDLENGAFSYKPLTTTTVGTYSFLHHTVAYSTPTNSGAVCYTDSSIDLVKTSGNSGVATATFKIKNVGFTSLFVEGTLRFSSVSYSTDGVNFTTLEDRSADSNFYGFSYSLPVGQDVYVRFASGTSTANCYMGNNAQKRFRIFGTVDVSSFKTLYNYPTNQNLYATYVKTLSTATTTATYRATKYGFPAIEFADGVYTYLKVDTTATGSTVAFSADGTTYTTVADGASIALASTTYPIVYVRSNITANRLYVSSNDYNADSAKDGSLKCNVQYKTLTQGLIYDVQDLQNEISELKAAIYLLQNP